MKLEALYEKNMRSLFFALLLLISPTFMHAAKVETSYLASPPQPLPVPVDTSIYLWKIENIDEKNQTFSAYIYLDLKWQDPRLAFSGQKDKPIIYSDEALTDKFKEIWWPDTDFVNAIATKVHNTSLAIYPDGTIAYSVKMSGTFFTPMNFRKFPFDQQTFRIHLQSFLWSADTLRFEVDDTGAGFAQDPFLDKFDLKSVTTDVKESTYLKDQYSEYEFSIHLSRHSGFYLYQILIPLFVVLGITVAMFFGDISDLSNKLLLGQGCILVLIAMKFMINESLPPIDYLTIIDYIFFVAYLCCGTAVAIACINHHIWKKRTAEHIPFNQHAIWIPVTLFLILYLLLFYFIISRH